PGEISGGVVNSNTSVVFTGKRELLERLQVRLEQLQIPNQLLNTAGVPSHSPLMKPTADIIDTQVCTVENRLPNVAIALNSGSLHEAKVPLPESHWSRQATGIIRFDRALEAMVAAGVTALVDLGPSRNLARFAHGAMNPAAIPAARDENDGEHTDRHVLLECLGALWAAGVAVDWKRASDQLEPFGTRRRLPLPTYSFDGHRCWPDGQPADPAVPRQLGERERHKREVFSYGQTSPDEQPDEEKKSSPEEVRTSKESTLKHGDPRKLFLDELRSLLESREIGLDDNFFDVGGDSLLAAELQARLMKNDRWRSPQLDEIMNATTFGDLYERIAQRGPGDQVFTGTVLTSGT
ncbi:phosphopantetheine-binding protein, partial [Mesorhizobium sp. M0026]|uniref:acyl carrier protein n=1 Tax=Mesorhizobium sp. M0026 TaxID=2956847 RepID=UPI00333C7626